MADGFRPGMPTSTVAIEGTVDQICSLQPFSPGPGAVEGC